jgi:hypothetical protein
MLNDTVSQRQSQRGEQKKERDAFASRFNFFNSFHAKRERISF